MSRDRGYEESAPKRRKLNDEGKTKITTLSELLDSLGAMKVIQRKIEESYKNVKEGQKVYEPTEEEQNLWETELKKITRYLEKSKYMSPLVELATFNMSDEELSLKIDLILKTEESIRVKVLKKSSDEYPNAVYEMIFLADKPGKISIKTPQVLRILKELSSDIGKPALRSLVEDVPIHPFPQVSAIQHVIDSGNTELVGFCLRNGIGSGSKFLVEGKEISLFEYLQATKNLNIAIFAANELKSRLTASDRIELLKLRKRNAHKPESQALAWVFTPEVEEELLKRVRKFNTKDFLELCDEEFLYSLSWGIWKTYIENGNIVKPQEVQEKLKNFQEIVNHPLAKKLHGIINNIVRNQNDEHIRSQFLNELDNFLESNQNTKIYVGLHALYVAARFGTHKTVAALLKAGANPNEALEGGFTPLYTACQLGKVDVVAALLESDEIDVNKANENGATPLFIACQNGKVDVVSELLGSDEIDVNKPADYGATPLYIACQNGHKDVVTALLESDEIDVNKAENGGFTPLYVACKNRHEAVVAALLGSDKIDVNQAANGGYTPLYVACQNGLKDVVRELLGNPKVDVNKALNNGSTPLYVGCRNGHKDVVELLINNKQKPVGLKAQYNNGSEALQFAAQGGNVEIINLILETQAFDVHYVNNENANALFYASLSGNIDAVRIFTNLGLNPNLKNKDGKNAILEILDNVISSSKNEELKAKFQEIKDEILRYIERYNDVQSKLTTEYARHLPLEIQQSLTLMQASSSTSLSSSAEHQDVRAKEKMLEEATANVLKELSKPKKNVLKVKYTPMEK